MQATEIVLPGTGEPESLQIRTREVGPPGPRRFPLTHAAGALRYAEAGGIAGKVLLIPDGNASQSGDHEPRR